MNSAKKITAGLVAMLSILIAHSQGITFRWTGGYAWQPGNINTISAPQINTQTPTVDSLVHMAYSNDATGLNKIVHNSYGHGFNIGMRLGYQINPYITVDIGASYAISKVISSDQIHTFYLPDSTGAIEPSGGYINASISTQSQSVILTPAITLAYAKPKFKFYPYLRVGLSLPVWSEVQHTTAMNLIGIGANSVTVEAPYFIGNQTYDTLKTKPSFTIGVSGAIGVVYRVHSFIQFFAEVNTQILNLKAKSSTYTGWTEDGIDSLSSRGASRNTIKSVPTLPFSNIGFNIGVQLFLNTKIFTDKDKFEENRKKKVKVKPKTEDDTPPDNQQNGQQKK